MIKYIRYYFLKFEKKKLILPFFLMIGYFVLIYCLQETENFLYENFEHVGEYVCKIYQYGEDHRNYLETYNCSISYENDEYWNENEFMYKKYFEDNCNHKEVIDSYENIEFFQNKAHTKWIILEDFTNDFCGIVYHSNFGNSLPTKIINNLLIFKTNKLDDKTNVLFESMIFPGVYIKYDFASFENYAIMMNEYEQVSNCYNNTNYNYNENIDIEKYEEYYNPMGIKEHSTNALVLFIEGYIISCGVLFVYKFSR